jgi:cardiolipin synthase (CMP-forming)
MSTPSPRPEPNPPKVARVHLGQLLRVPNIITLCRLGLVPVFLVLLSEDHLTEALYVFGLAALTDALDGAVARYLDIRTELGAIMDPFADKMLLLSGLVMLTLKHLLPPWLLIVAAMRDVVLVLGYLMISFASAERFRVHPSYFGKLTTVLQIGCVIGALTGDFRLGVTNWYALLYLTAGITVVSGVHYSYRGLVFLSQHVPELFS